MYPHAGNSENGFFSSRNKEEGSVIAAPSENNLTRVSIEKHEQETLRMTSSMDLDWMTCRKLFNPEMESTTLQQKQQQQQQQQLLLLHQQQQQQHLQIETQMQQENDSTFLNASRKRPSCQDSLDSLFLSNKNDRHYLNNHHHKDYHDHPDTVGMDGNNNNNNNIDYDDDDNVCKIRRLNLNDPEMMEHHCQERTCDSTAYTPSVNNASTFMATQTNIPKKKKMMMIGSDKHDPSSTFISPNDVMVNPYYEDNVNITIDFDGHEGSRKIERQEQQEEEHQQQRKEDAEIKLTQRPPSPPIFGFESDFFSPPATVKKTLIWGDMESSLDGENCHQDFHDAQSHGERVKDGNHYQKLPNPSFQQTFYNHHNHCTTRNSENHDNCINPISVSMKPPKTPMTRRKGLSSSSTSSGRRLPLFQLSPQKPKHSIHSSLLDRKESSPFSHSSPNPYRGNLDLHDFHMYDNHESSYNHGNSFHNCEATSSRLSQDFEIIGTLGDGSFGTVYKGLSRLDGCTYAIKEAKRRAKGRGDRERMLQEVKALAVLSDVSDVAAFHIVRYHQAWIEDDRLHIVTDLCTSTLHAEINGGMLKNDTQRQYKLLREMLLALKLIHQHGKVHLDIKPENIFVKDDKYKLGDFGLAVEGTTVGEVEEGDCRYMCRDLISGNHRDLTKVRSRSTYKRGGLYQFSRLIVIFVLMCIHSVTSFL